MLELNDTYSNFNGKTMKNNLIQTVHGVTYPVVSDRLKQAKEGDDEPPEPISTQLYREETAERLMKCNKKAVKLVKRATAL